MNIENLQKSIDYMRDEMQDPPHFLTGDPEDIEEPNGEVPVIFDMSLWLGETSCGTCACVGGTMNYVMVNELGDEKDRRRHLLSSKEVWRGSTTQENLVRWTGLSEDALDALFYPTTEHSRVHNLTSDLEHMIDVLEGIRDGRIVYARSSAGSYGRPAWHNKDRYSIDLNLQFSP